MTKTLPTPGPALREIVFDNLNSAVVNGYYQDLAAETPEQIAIELTAYAEDCQDIADHLLLPHVKAWIASETAQRAKLIASDHAQHASTVSA